MRNLLLTLLIPMSIAVGLAAEPLVSYPADSGIIDVRDCGAVGDGVADDTAALQQALTRGVDNHQIVYLPPGTFKVSATLRWKHDHEDGPSHGWGRFLQLRGAGQSRSVIRLVDHAAGFADPTKPQAVVQTGSSGSHGDKQYWNGEGNEAFGNHLRDFAVEVGAGNPGAIAIAYQASNAGAMRRVTLRAAPGSGLTAIDLTRRDNGPGLLSEVTIEGFAVAVRANQEICQFTVEHLTLRDQREVGVLVHDAIIALRDVRSRNQVPAVRIEGVGLCDLLDSTLTASKSTGPAVVVAGGEARLLMRDVTTSGYAQAIDARGTPVAGPKLAWWTADAAVGPLAASGASGPRQRITVRETPSPALPPAADWALVAAPGADDAAALEAAFATRKAVVCLRRADYRFKRGVTVPGHVRWLLGLGTKLDATEAMPHDQPLLRFTGGAAGDTTVVDAFAIGLQNRLFALHEDPRTLVLQDVLPFDVRLIENRVGAGPLFIDDCPCSGCRFARGTSVYLRQWNAEGGGEPKAVIDGAQVWALGSKHESAETVFTASAGSNIELYGGLMYTFGADQRPAIILTDSTALLSFAGTTYMPDGFFKILVRDTLAGKTTELNRDAVPGRGGGRAVTAYLTGH